MAGTVAVEGLRELTRTFNQAPKDVKKAYRAELRSVARPVQATAEGLALSEVRNIGPAWSQFRIGVTQKLVYVAPKQKSRRGRRSRPNLARLLADRVTGPALEKNRHRIEHDFDRMLDRLVTKWDHDGP